VLANEESWKSQNDAYLVVRVGRVAAAEGGQRASLHMLDAPVQRGAVLKVPERGEDSLKISDKVVRTKHREKLRLWVGIHKTSYANS